MSLVYADKSASIQRLEDNIRRVIGERPLDMLENVTRNWTLPVSPKT